MAKQTVDQTSRRRVAAPMGIGIALGIALGAATGHVALGLGAGIVLGGALVISRRRA